MSGRTLINNAHKYGGEYVATKSFTSREVIAHGKDAGKVLKKAEKNGCKNPVMIFVPEADVAGIY